MQNEILLEAKNISKRFGATVALDSVNFTLRRGQIHGLIGENGSGKSTLSSIIAGVLMADQGEIYYKDKPFKPSTMIDALDSGIGMIVQEGGTIHDITVTENIFLGESERFKKLGLINRKSMDREAQIALDNLGIKNISARQIMGSIDLQGRKLVEVAKVYYNSPEVLIVDETTTALSQEGRTIIYDLMKRMINDNKAVIFISHDLDELMEVCNVMSVLRDGRNIETIYKDAFDADAIKLLMVGRELTGSYYRDDYDGTVNDDIVLEVNNISKENKIQNISFNLRKGEILGIGGLSHSGMHTIGKCIFGFEDIDSGSIREVNSNTVIHNVQSAMRAGLGYVSKDRDIEALSLKSSIRENIAIVGMDKFKTNKGFITRKAETEYVLEIIESLNIKCRTMDQSVQELSGGNKQKVVFGKWIGRGTTTLVLDCPTRGVDIGVKQSMYQLIYKMKQEGKSIIIISEELTELIGMCDRLLIMKDGQISNTFMRSQSLSESDIIGSMI